MNMQTDKGTDPFKQIATCLGRLVEIEEYRAELERKALEKDGFRIAPLPPMKTMMMVSEIDTGLLEKAKTELTMPSTVFAKPKHKDVKAQDLKPREDPKPKQTVTTEIKGTPPTPEYHDEEDMLTVPSKQE